MFVSVLQIWKNPAILWSPTMITSTYFDFCTSSYFLFNSAWTITWIWRLLRPALCSVSLPPLTWKKHIPVVFDKTNPVLLTTSLSCTYNHRGKATRCLKRKIILQQLLKLFISTRWIQAPLKSIPTFFPYMNCKETGWEQCGSYETEQKWDLAQWSEKYQWQYFSSETIVLYSS